MDPVLALLLSLQNDVKQIDLVSQNVANISTPGYQSSQVYAHFNSTTDTNEVSSVVVDSDSTVKETGRDLDVGIMSQGFFWLEHRGEQFVSKNGRFHISTDGVISHSSGAKLRGKEGIIQVGNGNVQITNSGQVYSEGVEVGEILIVKPERQTDLTAYGKGLYRIEGNIVELSPKLKQGTINMSSISSSTEMIRLIELSRHSQSVQKALLAIDQTLDAGINKLGRN
jgi:flagellar basal body rod protein FlgG